MSGISDSTVNLIGQNALKKDESCVRWKCIRLTLYLFNSSLRPLGFKVSSFRIQRFSLCFNTFFLVCLLKVLLRICSIIIKLASLLKIWSFIANCLIFLYFHILIVLDGTSSNELFQTFVLRKAIIFSKALLVFKMDQ